MKIRPAAKGGPVTTGDAALPFYLQDMQENLITLTHYRGKMLLLCLYRSPDCPQCGLRLLHLVQAYPHLQAQGVEIVVVFEASPERVRYHTAPLFPPFSLVADPEHRVFQWYGVQSPWWGLRGALRLGAYWRAWRAHVGGRITTGYLAQRPAEILIGPDGIVRWAYYGHDIGDHLPLAALDTTLAQAASSKGM